ncbi:hypothetical protein GOP47_0014131, partial [Adiantum capillus-veneris]
RAVEGKPKCSVAYKILAGLVPSSSNQEQADRADRRSTSRPSMETSRRQHCVGHRHFRHIHGAHLPAHHHRPHMNMGYESSGPFGAPAPPNIEPAASGMMKPHHLDAHISPFSAPSHMAPPPAHVPHHGLAPINPDHHAPAFHVRPHALHLNRARHFHPPPPAAAPLAPGHHAKHLHRHRHHPPQPLRGHPFHTPQAPYPGAAAPA